MARKLFSVALFVSWFAVHSDAQVGPFSTLPPNNPPPPPLGSNFDVHADLVGQYNVKVFSVPHNSVNNPQGTFTVSGLPLGSTIEYAWLYTTSFGSALAENASVVFDGVPLGSTSAIAETSGGVPPGEVLFCRAYRYDVSDLVTTARDYDYSTSGTNNCFGDALVVVYSNPTFPVRALTVFNGATNMMRGELVLNVDQFAAGVGRLMIFSVADEVGGEDTIEVNGVPFIGPQDLFQANKGNYSSVVDLRPTLADGANEVRISVDGDWLGIHVAVLVSTFDCAANWLNYDQGHPGSNGEPTLSVDADPVLGSEIKLSISNSSGVDAPSVLILGFEKTSLPTSRGGSLLVQPFFTIPQLLPAAGFDFDLLLPNDLAFCGLSVFIQDLQLDAGASHGMSFTRGLELNVGTE